MTQSDIEKFSTILGQLADVFDKPLSETTLMAYFGALAEFSLDEVDRAARVLLGSCKYFPRPAEFREAIEGSALDRAETAWRTFDAASVCGEWPSAKFYDRAMAYAVTAWGGWIQAVNDLRAASPEMLASYEKRFKASYRLALNQPALCTQDYFAGAAEMNNRGAAGTFADWAAARKCFDLKVIAFTTTGHVELALPVDTQAMELAEPARLALAAGGNALAPYRPQPAVIRPMLAAAPEAEMGGDEKRALLAQIRSLSAGSARGSATTLENAVESQR